MAELPPDVAKRYAPIIDSILAKSDLNTISAKAIRKGLQDQLDHDITKDKQAVTALIMARFDRFNAAQNGEPTPSDDDTAVPSVEAPTTTATTNGHSTSSSGGKRPPSSDSLPSSAGSDTPPKKKQKKQRSTEDDDAAFAARLQAEENLASRARSTRGGGTTKRKAAPAAKAKKEKRKKKSSNKVGSGDDSDVVDSAGEKKSPKRTGGFHKPMNLSLPLQELLGETQLSRPQTVKKIWAYVKERQLQNPEDKRQIVCDDAMRAVFKQDSVHMFTMNKILNQNLYPVEEGEDGGEA